MRIHLNLKSDGTTVPFNHQPQLTGAIHKWIGDENREHGEVSLYSFSMLAGGRKSANGKGLIFEHGASFFISAHDASLIKTVVDAVQRDPLLFNGLRVSEIVIQEDPDLSEQNRFLAASPIFIKRKDGDRIKHWAFNEDGAADYLKETLQTKMSKVGMSDDTLTIRFDSEYAKAKCQVVHYNEIKNKANVCPVIIEAKLETKIFAWNVGLGNSTGIGLGAIK